MHMNFFYTAVTKKVQSTHFFDINLQIKVVGNPHVEFSIYGTSFTNKNDEEWLKKLQFN